MDKIKEMLHTPKSNEAARGEVDHTTPGSFPDEDSSTPVDAQQSSTTATSGHEHNKLHKASDPRGWTDEEKRARGHGYTDSGVGLIDHHESAPTDKPAEIGLNTAETATSRHEETISDQRGELGSNTGDTGFIALAPHQTESHSSAAPDTLDSGALPAVATSHEDQGIGHSTGDSKKTPAETPYWGDLPRGAGVYNTIAGHGSPEDDSQRHQAIHSGESTTEPTVASSSLNSSNPVDSSQPRAFPLVADSHAASNEPTQTNDQNNSQFKETAAGAAVVGTTGAGAAAYESGVRHDGDEDHTNKKGTTEPKHDESSKDSKILGIFHRGSKSDKAGEESTENQTVQESKDEKGGKLGGIFHRSGHNKDDSESTAQDTSVKDTSNDQESKNSLGLAAGGAGGIAAASAASNRHEDGEGQKDTLAASQAQESPLQTSGGQYSAISSEQTSGLQDRNEPTFLSNDTPAPNVVADQSRSHDRNAEAATVAAAGLGAGALSSRETEKKEFAPETSLLAKDTSDNTQAKDPISSSGATASLADPSNNGQYKTLASGTPSGVMVERESGGESGSTVLNKLSNPVEANTTDQSQLGTEAAAGLGATGLGAAALSSQNPKEDTVDSAATDRQTAALQKDNLPTSTSALGGSGANKVIHHCQKCGEENDISAYFNSNARGLNQ